ncbi:Na(+)-linked D-alanine glycine permease [Fulvivirga imtechensis AK7]|uniref:Na(+)-linked D-alanine glycine permease n=1 Tax=Fulvivirga imtechensis AK7 TaxID=1237149 RepID=L8JV03_9BACT|nr:sodium:alanine symporter family protein [Fulvivirga imtechensis]ELR72625.1 Na(+)-linked D-alanine glycine permease [Fulvivirga imtechensis AK7]
MQTLNDFLVLIDSYIGSAVWFPYALLGTGLFFTIYLGFPQLRYFGHALKVVRGKFDKHGDEGDASHFQALATALSGTVGTGNIGGVALAVYIGGPAALFWMLVTAFFGMTTKFVEVTLSHKYREKTADGTMAGGPMYYMKNRLNMKWLAAIFAVATILSSFGTGNMPQINNISNALFSTFGIKQWISGLVLAIILAMVILGGIRRIVKVTEKLVPTMAILYFLGALAVILYNYENIIPSFISIFEDVFTGTAATGGFVGATFSYAFIRGVGRGLFSNEAGQGSAPIAHAAAKAHEPVSEGMVAILEPFIDTIVICTLTGLVLLSSGVWKEKHQNTFQPTDLEVLATVFDENDTTRRNQVYRHLVGKEALPLYTGSVDVEEGRISGDVTIIHARSFAEDVTVYQAGTPYTGALTVDNGRIQGMGTTFIIQGKSLIHSAPLTAEAFKHGYFGRYGEYIVTIGLLLFAFSTAISWSYYGDRATTYLFGSKYVMHYRVVYILGFFFASFADTTVIWTLAGITIALMTIPNLAGILFLHKEMKSTVKNYWIDFKKDWPNEKTPE